MLPAALRRDLVIVGFVRLAGRDRMSHAGHVETGMLAGGDSMCSRGAGRDRYVAVECQWRWVCYSCQADLETGMLQQCSETWYIVGRV